MWKLPLIKSHELNGTCPGGWFLGNYSLGLEHSVIRVRGVPYLGRLILYAAGCTLRLHRFYKGDDARAPHDHPWSFWTFPLCDGYHELVVNSHGELELKWVHGWRWHYRPSSYKHIVLDPLKPFYTIVVTGRKDRNWGFWLASETFVPWREWK